MYQRASVTKERGIPLREHVTDADISMEWLLMGASIRRLRLFQAAACYRENGLSMLASHRNGRLAKAVSVSLVH
jgi:hypothetical protein